MTKQTITLTRAFKLRKMLKEKLAETYEDFRRSPKYWDRNEKPNFRTTNGKQPSEIIRKWLEINEYLTKLNILINASNQNKPQEIMLEINSKKATDNFLKWVINEAKQIYEPRKEINPVTGEEKITYYENFGDVNKYLELYKANKKSLSLYEDMLQEQNNTIQVDLTGYLNDINRLLDE